MVGVNTDATGLLVRQLSHAMQIGIALFMVDVLEEACDVSFRPQAQTQPALQQLLGMHRLLKGRLGIPALQRALVRGPPGGLHLALPRIVFQGTELP